MKTIPDHKHIGVHALIALLAGCFGCGAELPSRVSGTVTLDSEPVSGGTISFDPVGPGMMAFSKINGQGNYSLRTNSSTGLVPGKYEVMITVRGEPIWPIGGGLPTPGPLLIPEKYTRTSTSGLEFEVDSGFNRIDVALQSH